MKTEFRDILFGLVFFGIIIVTMSALWQNSILLLFVLACEWLTTLTFWRNKRDISIVVLGIIFGAVGESICAFFGAWTYNNPDIAGIPFWLPLAWGMAVLFVSKIIFAVSSCKEWK